MNKKSRLKLLFLILILNLSTSVNANVTLVMSKEDYLCNAFHEQLFVSPRIIQRKRNYTRVEEIHWRPILPEYRTIGNKKMLNTSSRKYLSEFDINNDGEAEVVLKWAASLGGSLNDGIYVFSKETEGYKSKGEKFILDIFENSRFYPHLVENTEFVLNITSQSYILNELNNSGTEKEKPIPAIYSNYDISAYWYGDGGSSEEGILGRYFIRISSVDKQANYHNYHVISRLDQNYQLHDVCYFKVENQR